MEAVTYAPGDQRLDAVIVDQAGNTATVTATHTGAAAGRLDSLATVLAGAEGEVRFVSGVVGRTAGGVVIESVGLSAGGRVIVPDLQPAGGSGRLVIAEDDRHEPLTAALIDTRGLLAEVAHRGLAHLPPTYDDRLAAAAHRLAVLGLHRIARAVTAFAASRIHDCDEAVERTWIDAYLRLDVTVDLN